MSNVLIGIIGVILFIGLALAGALFLGPRFQESANNSKASAAVQAVSQIASAANMANVQTGTTLTAASDPDADLRATGYLKAVPSNPVSAGTAADFVDSAGTSTGGGAAYMVIMPLGTGSDKICEAIARQSGLDPAVVVTTGVAALPTTPSGCFRANAAIGSIGSGSLVAFARV